MSILDELKAEGDALISVPRRYKAPEPVDMFRARRDEIRAYLTRCGRDVPPDPYTGCTNQHEITERRREIVLDKYMSGVSPNAISSLVFCSTQVVAADIARLREQGEIPASFRKSRAKTGG